jgi:hypothetical protein
MRISVRITAVIAGALLTLVVFAIAYSTARGYTVWFLKIPNTIITVNGTQTNGWLQKANKGHAVFFTLADSGKSLRYDLVFVDDVNGRVLSCGNWVASRLPLFPVGDVNLRCFFEGSAGHNLTRGPHSIAFHRKRRDET